MANLSHVPVLLQYAMRRNYSDCTDQLEVTVTPLLPPMNSLSACKFHAPSARHHHCSENYHYQAHNKHSVWKFHLRLYSSHLYLNIGCFSNMCAFWMVVLEIAP